MSVSGVASNGLEQALQSFEKTANRISRNGLQSNAADPVTDTVDLIQAKDDFSANLKVLEVADQLEKSALDILA